MIENDIRKHALTLMHKLISTESAMLNRLLEKSSFVQTGPVEAAGSLRGLSYVHFQYCKLGKLVSGSTLQLNIHPPEEDTRDIEESIAAIEKHDRIKSALMNKEYEASLKQLE